jgi:hypothetical protein
LYLASHLYFQHLQSHKNIFVHLLKLFFFLKKIQKEQ